MQRVCPHYPRHDWCRTSNSVSFISFYISSSFHRSSYHKRAPFPLTPGPRQINERKCMLPFLSVYRAASFSDTITMGIVRGCLQCNFIDCISGIILWCPFSENYVALDASPSLAHSKPTSTYPAQEMKPRYPQDPVRYSQRAWSNPVDLRLG